MQYPVSVIDDTPNSATSDEMTDIDAFNDGLQAAAGSKACNRRVEVRPFW